MDASQDYLANINALPEPQRSAMMASFTEIVLLRLADEAEAQLNDQQKVALEAMAETADADQLMAFMKQALPNFDQLLESIVTEQRELLAQQMMDVQRAITERRNAGA